MRRRGSSEHTPGHSLNRVAGQPQPLRMSFAMDLVWRAFDQTTRLRPSARDGHPANMKLGEPRRVAAEGTDPPAAYPLPDGPVSGKVMTLHARIVAGSGGGADKTTLNSPRFLRGTRYEELVAYLHDPRAPGFAAIRRRAAERACPLFPIADRGAFSLSPLFRLAGLCRRYRIAIWHGHEYKSNLFGLLLRPFFGFKLVTTVHGWVSHSRRLSLYYKVDAWCLRRYDRVIAVSHDLYEACRQIGVPEGRLQLIENGIIAEDYTRERPAAEARGMAAPAGRLVVGAMGRLAPEKGFPLLIEAVDRLLGAGHDIELWIAGEGGLAAELEREVAVRGRGERIKLLGFQADTRAFYEKLDIFCLSSLREGLPNVVLEAMAMEVPIIATICGGLGEFLRPGEDAIMVPPGSADAIFSGLAQLLDDAALRQRLAAAARARVERDLSFGARMRKIGAIYDGLLAIPDTGEERRPT